jgi:hypothetical protein
MPKAASTLPDLYLPPHRGPWAEDMAHRLTGDTLILLGLLGVGGILLGAFAGLVA